MKRRESLEYSFIVSIVCFVLMIVLVLAKVLVVEAASGRQSIDVTPAEAPYTETKEAGRNVLATNDVVGEKDLHVRSEGGNEVETEPTEVEQLTIMEANKSHEGAEKEKEDQATEELLEIEASENEDDYVEEQADMEEEIVQEYYWDGPALNSYIGVVEGPSGKETYYNLPMDGVISIMRSLGYDEENYPYSINEDGCKCLGDYIMVAANLELRPKGTIVPTSLGWGIVADTGAFAQTNRTQLDIAVNW